METTVVYYGDNKGIIGVRNRDYIGTMLRNAHRPLGIDVHGQRSSNCKSAGGLEGKS